jgi:hypothetical protein
MTSSLGILSFCTENLQMLLQLEAEHTVRLLELPSISNWQQPMRHEYLGRHHEVNCSMGNTSHSTLLC